MVNGTSHVLVDVPSSRCSDNAFGPASCRREFDFTLLFEQSILSILPSALLLIAVPIRLSQLYRASSKTLPTPVYASKAAAAALYACLQLALVILWSSHPRIGTRASVAAAALSFIDAIAIFILSRIEHKKTVRPSSLLNVYLGLSLLFDATQLRTLYLSHDNTSISSVMSASLGVKTILLFLEAQSKRTYLKRPYSSYPPEATSGVINLSFFWWLNGLFQKGFRRLMTYDDLFTIDEALMSESMGKRMKEAWDRRSKPETRYSLPLAVAYCFRWEFLGVIFPRLCLIGFNFSQPFLISRAITYVSQTATPGGKTIGYGLIGATFLIYAGIAFSNVHYMHKVYRIITMFRGGMVSIIYDRTLTLQDGVYTEAAAVTLMSTDIDNIADALVQFNEIWARTIEVCLGIWLLARQLGATCIVPLLVVGACVGWQTWVANRIGGRRMAWNAAIQRRVARTSSMLGAMKAVKMMGLSGVLASVIHDQRIYELTLARSFMWMIILLNVLAGAPEIWSPLLTFAAFTLKARIQGTGPLSTGQAFTSLSIISLVTSPAALLLVTIPQTASAMGCFTRIQDYFLLPSRCDERLTPEPPQRETPGTEPSENAIELTSLRPKSDTLRCAISFEKVSIRPAAGAALAVSDVDFTIDKGSLAIIVGPVGAGKTTLMRAMLGELPCVSGSVTVSSKRMAYCAQTSWVLNKSIMEVVCGLTTNEAVDEEWYRTVMHSCVLDGDMLQLPEGDRTVVGSKGLTLSGGQKQRLALARAVYARQDIILLDDVLSALDARSEESVVNRLLGRDGLFRKLGTTVVLVTHATRHLPLADKIVVLDAEGHIAQQGSHADLSSQEGFVRNVLSQHRNISEDETMKEDASPRPAVVKGPTEDDVADLTRRTGDISVYKYYAQSIGATSLVLFFITSSGNAFTATFPQVWLNWWTNAGGENLAMYLSVYALLTVLRGVFQATNMSVIFMRILPKSSIRLHRILLDAVMSAPLSFFSETDTGITLNRFSQDMSLIDRPLPIGLLTFGTNFFNCVGQAALIAVGSTYMAITIPFLMAFLYVLQDVYLKTSRQLRFMDLEAKSPLYSHFLETLDGLSTIRAFGWQQNVRKTNAKHLDLSQRPYYLLYCVQRWLNLVLDLVVAVLAVTVVTLAVESQGTTSGGRLGIALNNVLTFAQSLANLVTAWTTLEISLGAIARVKSFTASMVAEGEAGEDQIPRESWPEHGAIRFDHVSAVYNNDALALDDIDFDIEPGQKIGICGRTGSGKSSLLLTLLRLLNVSSGSIVIDGVDLRTISRDLIRSRMVAIPQDPFMLSGTVRLNADPTGTVSDDEIVSALRKIRLWDTIETRGGLDAEMDAQPLSQGQQQLFCLARAMLRKSRILILDEATSNVDRETDQLMQKTIREEFKEHTIITVAHRLDTIMDSDKIAVLGAGKVLEFDSPGNLLARNSAFRQLYGS